MPVPAATPVTLRLWPGAKLSPSGPFRLAWQGSPFLPLATRVGAQEGKGVLEEVLGLDP